MNLLILSLAPVVAIALYIYFRDKYEKEPIRMLFFALLVGALSVIPILFLENFLDSFTLLFPDYIATVYKAFVVVGFSEELFKFIALYLLIWKSKEFNEKFDGIVYGTYVSLGFAAVENILYVSNGGLQTGISRAITAVPAHAIFGITMGFYLGLARFYKLNEKTLKLKALLIPILLHGIYDFILFTGLAWLIVVFVAFVIFLYISGLKRIKQLSEQSIYKTDYNLLNEKLSKPD